MVKVKKQKVRSRRKDQVFQGKSLLKLRGIVKFLIGLVVLGAVGLGLIRLKYMFVDSDHFLVKGVDVKLYDEGGISRNLSLKDIGNETVMGMNIFFVDLNKLKENVDAKHPEFKDVVVRRLLPDRLVVAGRLRKAVAQIRSDRYYPVDRDGVLLPDVVNFPSPDLPIITGMGINIAKISGSSFGEFGEQKLKSALDLINEIGDNDKLKAYRLKVVDVGDPGNLTFSLETINVEIKIGNSDFHDRLDTLATVIDQVGQDINNFKYIDLRFEDPIMGPK